jgi:hypothetical protein
MSRPSTRRQAGRTGKALRVAIQAAAWLAVCASGLSPTTAQMVSGGKNSATGSGLRITVDTMWVDGNGYRPVSIEVVPLAPPIADRTLTVELRCVASYGQNGHLVVGRDIEVPAGSGPVVATLAVPEHFNFSACDFKVWDDGVYRKGLSFQLPSNTMWSAGWEEGLPNILVIGAEMPDSAFLAQILPGSQYSQQYGQSFTSGPNGFFLSTLMVQPPTRVPERWIDYTSLDVICVKLDRLQELSRARPAVWEAIRRWTAAGGTLWVFGAGGQWQRLGEIDRLLGEGDEAGGSAWSLPDAKHHSRNLEAGFGSYNYAQYGVPQPMPGGAMPAVPPVPQPAQAGAAPPFQSRLYMQGMVLAFSAEELTVPPPGGAPPADPNAAAATHLFPGTPEQWGWVLNHMQDDRALWSQRHGLSLGQENVDFWNWLVPGVNLAPVTAFRVLITLFVLAIGPLNYWLLWRKGRLHWLLVIVPLAALAITGGLFGYAMLADGLGVRVRVRSITHLDQARGEAVCWSRLSYYAGLSPYGGLTFPDDVEVVPLAAGSMESSEHPSRLVRALDWTSEGQRMTSGWLAARTPTQYLTVRSRKSPHGIDVRSEAGGPPTVKNRLGTRIHHLVVIGEDGEVYRGGDLADGASAPLELRAAGAEADEAVAALRAAIVAAAPQVPPGVQFGGAYGGSYGGLFGPTYYYSRGSSTGLPDPVQAAGRLEQGIAQVGWKGTTLAPRSYLAIVERSPEVVVGVAASGSRPASTSSWGAGSRRCPTIR